MAKYWIKIYNYLPSCDNIYSSIYPLHFLVKLFGLAPYEMVTIQNKSTYVLDKFTFGKYLLMLVSYVGIFIYNIWTTLYSEPMDTLIQTLMILLTVISNCLSTVEIILSTILMKNVIQIFKILDDVDYCLNKMDIRVDYKGAFLKSSIFSILIVLTFVPVVIVFYESYEFVENVVFRWITAVIEYGPYMVNIIVEVQYVAYMWLVLQRYKLLNQHLMTLLAGCEDTDWLLEQSSKVSMKIPTKPARTHALTPLVVPPPEGKLFFLTAPVKLIDEEQPVIIVDNVASLHIKLADTAQLINKTFRIQLLLIITICFIGIVTALFLAAVQFSMVNKSESPDNLTVWACMNALEIVALVYITCSTCEEANRCPRILHRIRNNTHNVMLQDTIEVYSLQMYHNRLHFHVCGLFPLDYTLLYSIVAGVTTYLVILIQFNSTESPKNNKTNETSPTALAKIN